MATLKPLNDNILIKRDPLPKSKVGSIYLPESYAGAIHKVRDRGSIVAIGDKVTQVKIGNRVIFGRFAYQDFDKSEELIIVRECDILGVISD
jgi:co-chaperonin GroES (HSP10)